MKYSKSAYDLRSKLLFLAAKSVWKCGILPMKTIIRYSKCKFNDRDSVFELS